MKTVLLVPGFRQNINSINYRGTIKAIKDKGYRVKFVPINWRHTTLKNWAAQLEEEYAKYDPQNTILAGFSYGSLTVLVAANAQPPSELWLFSLSPYFADDLVHIKETWLQSKRRRSEFANLRLSQFKNIRETKTLLFLGEIEARKYPFSKKRSQLAATYFRNSKLIMIPEADHDVGDLHYVSAIKRNIG